MRICLLPFYKKLSKIKNNRNCLNGMGPHTKSNIQTLEQVQRGAARYVFNYFSTKTPGCVTNMMSDLGWESLECRRRRSRLAMMFEIRNNLVDIPSDRYLQRSDTRTRGQHRFSQERINNTTYANSFYSRTIKKMEQSHH